MTPFGETPRPSTACWGKLGWRTVRSATRVMGPSSIARCSTMTASPIATDARPVDAAAQADHAAQDCSTCALKPRFTTAERRSLKRHFHEDALQWINARVAADPGLIRQRPCAAEHPFGTIKRT